jgi:hypothetical protein
MILGTYRPVATTAVMTFTKNVIVTMTNVANMHRSLIAYNVRVIMRFYIMAHSLGFLFLLRVPCGLLYRRLEFGDMSSRFK